MTAAEVRAVLAGVDDPHVPVSLERMGMLADVAVADSTVEVRVRIPCMACPGTGMLRDAIETAVAALPGVRTVSVVEDWGDPWHREMVEPSARDLMRRHGIQI